MSYQQNFKGNPKHLEYIISTILTRNTSEWVHLVRSGQLNKPDLRGADISNVDFLGSVLIGIWGCPALGLQAGDRRN